MCRAQLATTLLTPSTSRTFVPEEDPSGKMSTDDLPACMHTQSFQSDMVHLRNCGAINAPVSPGFSGAELEKLNLHRIGKER